MIFHDTEVYSLDHEIVINALVHLTVEQSFVFVFAVSYRDNAVQAGL